MKRLAILIGFLLGFIIAAMAQENNQSEEQTGKRKRFYIEAGSGFSYLCAATNLSPYGLHYRGGIDNGVTYDVQFNYNFKDFGPVGLKYSGFTASGNYTLADGMPVADDVDIHYIAPQIGYIVPFAKRFLYTSFVGAGCAFYKNESTMGEAEREYKKAMFAAHANIGVKCLIVNDLYIGLNMTYMYAQAKSLEEKVDGVKQTIDLGKKDRIRMNRMDFSVSLTRYF